MEQLSINARVNNERVGEVWSLTAGGRTSNQPLIVTKNFIGWRTQQLEKLPRRLPVGQEAAHSCIFHPNIEPGEISSKGGSMVTLHRYIGAKMLQLYLYIIAPTCARVSDYWLLSTKDAGEGD